MRWPRVLESAVFGVPHPDFGEAVTVVVVPEKGARLREADIIDQLRLRLANYKLPKRIVIADDLPRNTMAKVQKNLLREQHKALFV
jgi:malonyl-CoA/methylmalonyl-CoA synthetase